MKPRATTTLPTPNHGAAERVAAYARVSTDMQAEDGLSIAAQLTEIREYAEARGWQVVSEFVDAGITGQTLDRPGLQAMLLAAAQGAFDILIVHELSRLSRSSVYDTFAIFDHLGRCKVGFASVKEPQFDLTNPTGRFLLTIIAAINQYYIDILRLHTKKAKRERAREGLYNASIIPYGYALADSPRTPPTIVEAEAQVVRFMFEHYATGRYSFLQIAELANDRGWRTRSGRRFSKDTVNDMLSNPFYIGKVVYRAGARRLDDGELFEGQHEPLITEDLWEACQRIRQRHQYRSRTLQAGTRPYLLSHIARCHFCGRTLRAQTLPTGSYYRETSYERGYDDCPDMRTGVRGEPLHRQLAAIVRLLQLPPDWQADLQTLSQDDDEVATLTNRRQRLEAERRRLKEAYVRGDFAEDEDIYRRELERIRRELTTLPATDDLYQVRQAVGLLESLSTLWDAADEGDRRDLVQLMLREVLVDVTQARLCLLAPYAPFIPLLRRVPILAEREPGRFVPVWTPDLAAALGLPTLPPLTAPPPDLLAPPFLAQWPWPPDPNERISPSLSALLKARRSAGQEGGLCVAVPHPGVPTVVLDSRKWPHVSLQRLPLADALRLPAGAVACLETPLAVRGQPDLAALSAQVYQLLAPGGYWHFVELMPSSMPAHWAFTYFPELWLYVVGMAWSSARLFGVLRQAGFQVQVREHTFYQAHSPAAMAAIARQRGGLLAVLEENAYRQGLARLEEAAQAAADAGNLVGSEVTLVEVTARKGGEEKPRRRRRKRQ